MQRGLPQPPEAGEAACDGAQRDQRRERDAERDDRRLARRRRYGPARSSAAPARRAPRRSPTSTTSATLRSMPRHTNGMSLTLGTGPLGSKPSGAFNFALDGAPAHRLYFEPFPRRVRPALVDDRIVLDSVRGQAAVRVQHPAAAVRAARLQPRRRAARAERDEHALPVQGRRRLPLAARRRAADRGRGGLALRGADRRRRLGSRASPLLYWAKADALVRPRRSALPYGLRDPYHRVDVVETSRPVRVTVVGPSRSPSPSGRSCCSRPASPHASTSRARTSRPVRSRPRPKRTTCPYKGEATYWDVRGIADRRLELRVAAARVARRPPAPVLPGRGDRGRAGRKATRFALA